MIRTGFGIVGALAVGLAVTGCGDKSAEARAAKASYGDAAASQTAAAADSPDRTFRDWYVACDNALTCFAFGHGTEQTAWVRVMIPGGPQGRPTVSVGVWPGDGELDANAAVAVQIDGRRTALTSATDAEDIGFPVATASAADSAALVAAMTSGEAMSVTAGDQTAPISLSGASAAMLWIDERQGRLGTTTALIRKGARPASTVPASPAAPHVIAAPAVSQAGYGDQEGQRLPASVEALPAVVQCRADTDFNPDLQAVIASARLDQQTVMWSVPCGAGAYNFSNAYFTTRPDGSNPRQIAFPSTGEPLDLLVNAAFDPVTRTLDAFDKGRGLGDCGTASTWVWTTRGFVMTRSSGMADCNGVPSAYWPTFLVSQ